MERILVALGSKANAKLINDLLKNNYNIQIYTTDTKITQSFDLLIVDGKTLTALKQKQIELKKSSGEIFQPVLLVSSKKASAL